MIGFGWISPVATSGRAILAASADQAAGNLIIASGSIRLRLLLHCAAAVHSVLVGLRP